MDEYIKYLAPTPVVNKREASSLDGLTERYNKLIEPGVMVKVGKKAVALVPEKLKSLGIDLADSISAQKIYKQAMELVADGFKVVEEQAARLSISEKEIIKKVNDIMPGFEITELNEICFARSYQLAKLVNSYKNKDILAAFVEGGATGALGFWGLPFNFVLSTFLFFRAVQSIAMHYGYDVKNDSAELVIASEVFTNALSPMNNDVNNEVNSIVCKVMLMSQASLVKQTAKKTWTDMASRKGIPLLLVQMRALANKSAKTALEKAGEKGLENSIFRDALEQIGKKITQKSLPKIVPYFSAALGAFIDTSQMNRVLEYADIFYQKRYILEKESRILALTEPDNIVIDVEPLCAQ